MLDTYEANEEKDAKHIVKKICDIITLLSNDGMKKLFIFQMYYKISLKFPKIICAKFVNQNINMLNLI